ncbi:hypothetical protein ACQJBY_056906 [Aegilops geniculata]
MRRRRRPSGWPARAASRACGGSSATPPGTRPRSSAGCAPSPTRRPPSVPALAGATPAPAGSGAASPSPPSPSRSVQHLPSSSANLFIHPLLPSAVISSHLI